MIQLVIQKYVRTYLNGLERAPSWVDEGDPLVVTRKLPNPMTVPGFNYLGLTYEPAIRGAQDGRVTFHLSGDSPDGEFVYYDPDYPGWHPIRQGTCLILTTKLQSPEIAFCPNKTPLESFAPSHKTRLTLRDANPLWRARDLARGVIGV